MSLICDLQEMSLLGQIYTAIWLCAIIVGFVLMVMYFVDTWREELEYWERIEERKRKVDGQND